MLIETVSTSNGHRRIGCRFQSPQNENDGAKRWRSLWLFSSLASVSFPSEAPDYTDLQDMNITRSPHQHKPPTPPPCIWRTTTMASETKHTPGPWKFVVDRDGLIYRLCGDGMWFAKLSWTVTGDRNDADARLIAAAPDMLVALQKLANEVGGLEAFEPEVRQAIGNTNWNVLQRRLAEADTLLTGRS